MSVVTIKQTACLIKNKEEYSLVRQSIPVFKERKINEIKNLSNKSTTTLRIY